MSGRQVLKAVKSELKPVFDTDFLEKARQINLDGPLRDKQHRSNFFVLQPLAKQADELPFALGEGDALGRKEAVCQRLFKPELAFIYALEAFNKQVGRQRLAKNSAYAERHSLQRQLR